MNEPSKSIYSSISIGDCAANLEELLAETQAELHFVVGAYEEAKAETLELQRTVSWRLTAPVRAVRKWFVRRRT